MTTIVKISGKPIAQPEQSLQLWQDIARAAVGARLVIVHGGGMQVDALMARLGEPVAREGGIRLTPSSQMPFVAGVLAGQVNQEIVGLLRRAGAQAVGISLASADVVLAEVDPAVGGRVGRVTGGDAGLIETLLRAGYLPVVSSIGCAADGGLLNINADAAAAGVAKGIGADRLLMLTDVAGVLDASGELVPRLDGASAASLIEAGVISGGMTAKVRAAIGLAESTGVPVSIAPWADASAAIEGSRGTGTTLLPATGATLSNEQAGELP